MKNKIKRIIESIAIIIGLVFLIVAIITGSILALVLCVIIFFAYIIFDFVTSLMDYIEERKKNKRR